MKTSAWWVVVALGVWSCAPFHQPVKRPATTHPSTTLELPSGMRVVIEERPGSHRVAMAMLVGAGGRQDPVGKEGLAHFVEHLVFRGRPTHRLTLMDELHYAAAADVNAMTTHDATTFLGVAPTARVEQFLPLLAATAARPLEGVSDEAFEIERNVVRSELFTLDDPHGVGPVTQKLVELVTPPQATDTLRALGGTPESLATFTRADVEAFIAANYRPERTTVVVAGDVTAAQIKALLPAAFLPAWLNAPSSGGPREPRRIETALDDWLWPPNTLAKPVVVEAPVSVEHLQIGWSVPGKAAQGGALVPMLVQGLRGLDARVKSKQLSVDVDVLPGSRSSVLYLDVELPPGVTAEEASAALREKTLTAELSGVKWRQLLMTQAEQEQDPLYLAFSRADRFFNSQSANGAREMNATAAKALLEQALSWDRARELVVRPAKRASGTAGGALPAPLQERPPVLQTSPADFKTVALGLPVGDTRSFTLPNGLQVVLSRRTEVPLASVSLTLPLGARHVSRSTEFWVPLVLDWRINNDAMNRVGAPVLSMNADTTTVHDAELSTQLPVLIDWLGHFLRPSTNSTPGLFALLRARATWESTSGVFHRLPFDLLPADSRFRPVGSAMNEERSWLEMSRFLDAAWRPNGAALVIDGDLDLDATEAQVRELFSDWSRQSSSTLLPLKERAAPPRRDPWSPKLVSVANRDTTRVEFGCRLPPLASPELRGGAELLQRALSLYFEEDLRSARGVTYGAWVRSTVSSVEDNLLNLSLVVDARDGQAATKRFFALLDALDGAVWDDVLVNRARWRVAQQQLTGESGSTVLARELSEALVRGASLEEALNQPLRWSQTPIKWVDELWAACNDTYELRVEGDEATLEPLLAPRRK